MQQTGENIIKDIGLAKNFAEVEKKQEIVVWGTTYTKLNRIIGHQLHSFSTVPGLYEIASSPSMHAMQY